MGEEDLKTTQNVKTGEKIRSCEKCKKIIDDPTANFCPECGGKIIERDTEKENITIIQDIKTEEKVRRCEKCKKIIYDPTANFCPECGGKIIEVEKEDSPILGAEKLSFNKKKWFVWWVSKEINTEVELTDMDLRINQTVQPFIRSAKQVQKSFLRSDIQMVEMKTKWDFWDLLYTFFFIVAGLANHFIFLLALLFAYTAYGKILKITLKNGEVFDIPLKGNAEEAQILIDKVNKAR